MDQLLQGIESVKRFFDAFIFYTRSTPHKTLKKLETVFEAIRKYKLKLNKQR